MLMSFIQPVPLDALEELLNRVPFSPVDLIRLRPPQEPNHPERRRAPAPTPRKAKDAFRGAPQARGNPPPLRMVDCGMGDKPSVQTRHQETRFGDKEANATRSRGWPLICGMDADLWYGRRLFGKNLLFCAAVARTPPPPENLRESLKSASIRVSSCSPAAQSTMTRIRQR